ncbi:MAG: hypothetical protein R3247_10310, partial [Rhodothermales bacterium]|nr:hypothetical protein [Rhodothermales bacterium]
MLGSIDLRRNVLEAGRRLGRAVRAAYAEPFVREAAPPGVLRRRRLLIICSALLAAAAFLFALQALRMRGTMTPISAVLLLGGGLALTYPLLRQYTGSSRAPGLALVLEYVALTALVVFHGNGFHGAALLWAPVAPLLAAYLVSHRAGFATAGLVVAELAVIYGLDRAGYPFPDLAGVGL